MRIIGYKSLAVTAVGLALGCNAPNTASTSEALVGSNQLGEIYQLQAAYHSAKTHQDLDSLMALWDDDSVLDFPGVGHWEGKDAIRGFYSHSGSFLFHRFSLVPSFKTKIDIHGNTAFLYFECHDTNFDTRTIASAAWLAGTIKHVAGEWRFSDMHAGIVPRLDADTQFYNP